MDKQILLDKIAELHQGRWYQRIDLGDGIFTPGEKDGGDVIWPKIRKLLPHDLSGSSMLDISSNAGLFCVRAALDGVGKVVGVEPDRRFIKQAEFIKHYFEEKHGRELPITYLRKKMDLKQKRVIDCDGIEESLGMFDFVLVISIIYHFHDQVAAARCIDSLAEKMIIGRFVAKRNDQRFTTALQKLGWELTEKTEPTHKNRRYFVRYERGS